MALPQVKLGALEARLSRMQPIDTGWSASARAAALNTLNAMGLPDRRDEYWKYTNPAALVAPEAAPAQVLGLPEAALCGDLERLKIVFVDGVFDPEASDDLIGSGVQIDRLAACQDLDLHWAKPVYGSLEAQGQVPVERPLAALNTAFASDGVLIHVTAAVKPILNIVYRHENPLSDVMLHHLIKLEPNASLTLVENGPVAARSNLVMEVEVADQAQFHHIRAQGQAADDVFNPRCFLNAQGRGGFIHNDQLRAPASGPADGHALALPARHARHGLAQIGNFDAGLFQQFSGAAHHGFFIQPRQRPKAKSHRFAPQKDVGGHIQVIGQRKVLINRFNAMGACLLWRGKIHRLPIDKHRAAGALLDPGDIAHKGGFARAIIADDGDMLVCIHFEIGII